MTTLRRRLQGEVKHFTHKQMSDILQAASRTTYPLRNSVLLRTTYIHGLRVSETGMLKLSNIEFENEQIYITREKDGKSGYHRIQTEEVKELRKLYKEQKKLGKMFLFESRNEQPISRRQCNNILKECATIAGLEYANMHMLRHTCGVHLALSGMSTVNIAEWLGHRDIRNTVIYTEIAAVMMNREFDGKHWAKS